MFPDLLEAIDLTYFFLSSLLFFAGIYLAPTAIEKNLDFLLRYPRWILRITRKYFNDSLNIVAVFLIIFSMNNLSLVSSFLSGIFVVLPPIAAFLTGFNISVMSYELMGWRGIWQILVNPVAWLEFPAAFISFSLAHRLAESQLTHSGWNETMLLLGELWPVYLKYVFTLLLASATLETLLIAVGRRLSKNNGK